MDLYEDLGIYITVMALVGFSASTVQVLDVYILNRRYSGICGGSLYGQTSNPSFSVEEIDVFKINNDDDDDTDYNLHIQSNSIQ